MRNKVVNYLYEFLIKHKNPDEKHKKIYKFGLEGLFNLVTKTIVILIISLLIHSFTETIILLFTYSLIRMFAFGLHSNSSLKCWISTLTIYTIGSLLIKHLYISKMYLLIIDLLSLIIFIIWAPADTPKRPIIRESNRKKLKYKSCIVCLIYITITIFNNYRTINNAISLSLLLEAICVNPLSYRITKTRFNNYKYYKKGHNVV